jgi:hypothetical protein
MAKEREIWFEYNGWRQRAVHPKGQWARLAMLCSYGASVLAVGWASRHFPAARYGLLSAPPVVIIGWLAYLASHQRYVRS